MRRYYERFRHHCKGLSRAVAAVVATLILTASLFTTVLGQDIVHVTDSVGNQHTMLTTGMNPEEIIEMVSQAAAENDKLTYTENPDNTTSVNILRAFPVSLKADGLLYEAEMADGTVGNLLEKCQITLSGEDYVEPALDALLGPDLQVEIHRVTYKEENTRAEVEEEVVDAYHEKLLAKDPASPFRHSNADIYDVTYRHRLIDNKVTESEVLSLVPVITPRDPGVTAFEPGIPCSTIAEFEDVEMGIDGLPVNATRVMRNTVCTAYSSSGGRGSSGLGLYCGTVAVNPNVIPYGTRMFITSADQNFVYGFAIATDTGTAMMQGHVGVDLYFATNAECRRFGKRTLDVYILD